MSAFVYASFVSLRHYWHHHPSCPILSLTTCNAYIAFRAKKHGSGSLIRCRRRACGCKKRPGTHRAAEGCWKSVAITTLRVCVLNKQRQVHVFGRWAPPYVPVAACGVCSLSTEQPGEQRTARDPTLLEAPLHSSVTVPGSAAQHTVSR